VTSHVPPDTDPAQLAQWVAEAKEQLRVRVAALRRTVPADARAARSRAACERLAREVAFERARTVCMYMALRFELEVSTLCQRAWAAGKRVALPRVDPAGGGLTLHTYTAGDELVESPFMVREPPACAPPIADAEVDLVLVPGLAFAESGHRLGFGKGFYDRLLPRLSAAERIGVAYDFQLLAEVPHTDHDEPVHRVVTDARSLECKSE